MFEDITTIKAGWETYEPLALPSDAGADQRLDMQRSFYAGVSVALIVIAKAGRSDNPSQGIHAITVEVAEFCEGVLAERIQSKGAC